MQRISEMIKKRAAELLESGEVSEVLGWQAGDFHYDPVPTFFSDTKSLDSFVYDGFCGANLSGYLVEKSKEEGKTLALLKPCDTYSLNRLIGERRVGRDKVYVIGVGCRGMLDIEKIRAKGIKGIQSVEDGGDTLTVKTLYGDKTCPRGDVLLEKCMACKGGEHRVYDERIGEDMETPEAGFNRFAGVEALEAMAPDRRFAFWRGELSKCIRCNACRNVCPVCSCRKCVFDNPASGVDAKANTDTFEENMFHIIRAFHVAGRCTDCGECSRVCPQRIPLHLLNRKFIKDINELYGEYQSGLDADSVTPLTSYTAEDAEPGVIYKRGGAH